MKTDKKTLDLINEVKRQRAEIAKSNKPNYQTNMTFSYIEGSKSNAVALNVESNVKSLIAIVAFLQDRSKSYIEAAKLLDVDSPPEFTWDGYSVGDWVGDIKTRIAKIQISSKKAKLELLEARLEKVISPELRAEMELEAISAELKK